MEIKLGFATKHSPTVTIELNNKLIDTVLLDCACDVDDLEGALQMVTINADLPESNHTLRVVAKDIKDDEIIQVSHIELDNINMAGFVTYSTTYNPITDGYINHIIENNLENVVQVINDTKFHVKQGEYANCIHMPNGIYEYNFSTPLYNFLFNNRFGRLIAQVVRN